MHLWVLLLYKVPSQPTARRVYVWRKLRRLGAVLLHDALWVLPSSPWTVEQFEWLAMEIRDMRGTAMVWEARLTLDGQDTDLVHQFSAQVDELYGEILADIERLGSASHDRGETLVALARRFQQAQVQDYFHAPLGERVRAALAQARDQERACGDALDQGRGTDSETGITRTGRQE